MELNMLHTFLSEILSTGMFLTLVFKCLDCLLCLIHFFPIGQEYKDWIKSSRESYFSFGLKATVKSLLCVHCFSWQVKQKIFRAPFEWKEVKMWMFTKDIFTTVLLVQCVWRRLNASVLVLHSEGPYLLKHFTVHNGETDHISSVYPLNAERQARLHRITF